MCGSFDGYRMEGGEWPADETFTAQSGEEHVKQLHIRGRWGGNSKRGVCGDSVRIFDLPHGGKASALCSPAPFEF